ncbi:MAG TPA: DUF5367 family protein [Candidatus Acidoferrum sp.]|jgi:hypothetical protein
MFTLLNFRMVYCGLAIWVAATAALRWEGQRLLRPGGWRGTAILFAISFPLMAWVVQRLCRRFGLRQEEWLNGAVSIVLPTLLLDPLSSVLFSVVFPNIDASEAGIFGGWMLWCCAGALAGASVGRREAA